MLQPTTHTWRNAQPTGIGFNPRAYAAYTSMREDQGNPLVGFSGIGDGPTTTQLESLAATGASTTVALLTAFSVIGGPVGAAIGAAIGVAMAVAQFFKGCGQTCIITSDDANKLEPYLVQNLNAYLASPIRTTSMQAAALNNFDTIWNTLAQACNNPQYVTAGVNCVQDRQAGSCKWQASKGGWVNNGDGTCTYTPYGPAGSGTACWNWFIGYRSPISEDPCVVPDSVLTALTNGTQTAGNPIPTSTPGTGTSTSAGNPNVSAVPGTDFLSSIPVPVLLGVGLIAAIAIATGGD